MFKLFEPVIIDHKPSGVRVIHFRSYPEWTIAYIILFFLTAFTIMFISDLKTPQVSEPYLFYEIFSLLALFFITLSVGMLIGSMVTLTYDRHLGLLMVKSVSTKIALQANEILDVQIDVMHRVSMHRPGYRILFILHGGLMVETTSEYFSGYRVKDLEKVIRLIKQMIIPATRSSNPKLGAE